MNAYQLSNAIGGWENGQAYAARCPICNNDKATLSIWDSDTGIGLKCFYNTSGQCHPMALVYHWQSIGIDISLDDLTSGKGGGPSKTWDSLWHGAKPIEGTFADDYLYNRGIDLYKRYTFHPPLRCIDYLKHPTSVRYPAMIALIVDPITDKPKAIHRTYLNHMGTGKAPVEPNKMSLGPARGGVVKFGGVEEDKYIVVGGGLETAMSWSIMHGHSVWSTIGEGNMSFIEFPPGVTFVGLIRDQDKAGREAVAAAEAVYRSRGLGAIIFDPEPGYKDFNDQLMHKKSI